MSLSMKIRTISGTKAMSVMIAPSWFCTKNLNASALLAGSCRLAAFHSRLPAIAKIAIPTRMPISSPRLPWSKVCLYSNTIPATSPAMATIHASTANRRRRPAADCWPCVARHAWVTSVSGLLSDMFTPSRVDAAASSIGRMNAKSAKAAGECAWPFSGSMPTCERRIARHHRSILCSPEGAAQQRNPGTVREQVPGFRKDQGSAESIRGLCPGGGCHAATRSRRLAEEVAQDGHVARVDDAVAVEVGIRIRRSEHAAHVGSVLAVHDAVVVEVRIAAVAVAIAVRVALIRVGAKRAVVDGVEDGVAVRVDEGRQSVDHPALHVAVALRTTISPTGDGRAVARDRGDRIENPVVETLHAKIDQIILQLEDACRGRPQERVARLRTTRTAHHAAVVADGEGISAGELIVAREHADDEAATLCGPDIGLVVRRTFAGIAADDHAAVRRHRVGAAEEGAIGRCEHAFHAVHPAHAAPLTGFGSVPADDDRAIGVHRVGTTRVAFEAAEADHSRAVLP